MTDTQDPRWLTKMNAYFRDAFQVHEPDLWGARRIRRIAKWWLEFVRNVLVVSAFYFLAQKSDSALLKLLANLTFFVLFAYVTSFANTFSFKFFPYIKNRTASF